eukprot:6607635-Pyramimonas_sp.AAC.1
MQQAGFSLAGIVARFQFVWREASRSPVPKPPPSNNKVTVSNCRRERRHPKHGKSGPVAFAEPIRL